ncbi:MAG: glutathione-disulfide reductase [Pseudomonadota bacterium]|nr:glutathione-disulfide reductase [Pseudomonadota bacterium]
MTITTEFLVIGGGSAGVATARRAAKHGARVILIERDRMGGTCVNVGCVPKKVMWQAGRLAKAQCDMDDYGFDGQHMTHDWARLVQRREAYIQRLNGIYDTNLEREGVEVVRGDARFVGPRRVQVGDQFYEGEHVLIAVGGRPERPDIPGAELGIDSDGFFALEERPARVAVIGAGYIAVELAGILQALGTETSLLYRRDTVLRDFDAMLGPLLVEAMTSQGVRMMGNTVVSRIEQVGEELHVDYGGPEPLRVEQVLWAVGRRPVTDTLDLPAAGVESDARGFVPVDPYQNTNQPGVYAVGDVTGGPALTPVAIAAGRRLADRIFGGQADRHLDMRMIPTVVFSSPTIGTVGLTEAQARDEYGDDAVKVYQSTFRSLYYGVLDNKQISCFKLICVGPDERVVGCHLFGGGADEMLQGFAVAMRMGARKRDLDDTVAIHPTSAEELVTMT